MIARKAADVVQGRNAVRALLGIDLQATGLRATAHPVIDDPVEIAARVAIAVAGIGARVDVRP